MTEHTPTPWSYRPQKYDDWGYIRGPKEPDGFAPLAAVARGEASETHDAHRAAGTDPYGPNALLIVKAVNNHDDLVTALDWAMKRVIRKAPHFAYEGDGELYAFAHAHSLLAKLKVIPDPVGGARD